MDAIGQLAGVMEMEQRRLERAAGNLSNVETDGFSSHLGRKTSDAVPLRPTGRPFDLTASGGGSLTVAARTKSGVSQQSAQIRSGSFHRDRDGYLVDERGRALIGNGGPVRVEDGTTVRPDGAFVRDGSVVAQLTLPQGGAVRSGFLAGSDVNPIGEMVEILDAQRQFETAQKTISAIDSARSKATSDVGKIQ